MSPDGRSAALAAACLLTALGLLAKEAALAIPAVLAVVWVWRRGDRTTGMALLGSALCAGGYLLLRLGVISAGSGNGDYGWSLLEVPARLLEYALFPWMLREIEPVDLISRMTPMKTVIAAMGCAAFVGVLGWRSWRAALLFAAAAVAALGPTLVLKVSFGQYGYGLAAVVAAAFAWSMHRPGRHRLVVAASLLAMSVHAQGVAWKFHALGVRQEQFHRDLVAVLRDSADPVRIVLPDQDTWFFQRITHDVPSYRGEVIRGRVSVVDARNQATHLVSADGRLRPN